MIYTMADINKFHRSRERIAEIYHYLVTKPPADEKTNSYIQTLEQSIRLIDIKIEEHNKKQVASPF